MENELYYVAVPGGEPQGPYPHNQLTAMGRDGSFTNDTLIYCNEAWTPLTDWLQNQPTTNNLEYSLNRDNRQSTGNAVENSFFDAPPPERLDYHGRFCLTGIFTKVPRAECARIIAERGGMLMKQVTLETTYLVVGDEENAEWKYGNLGTKIERALELRQQYHRPLIISADTLLNAADAAHADAHASLSIPASPMVRRVAGQKDKPYFLSYLGMPDAEKLAKNEAYELLGKMQDAAFQAMLNGDAEASRLMDNARIAWQFDRFAFAPEIFARLQPDFFAKRMTVLLQEAMRRRCKFSTESRTLPRINEVIAALNEQHPDWWRKSTRFDLFYQKLGSMFPRCCDGQQLSPDDEYTGGWWNKFGANFSILS